MQTMSGAQVRHLQNQATSGGCMEIHPFSTRFPERAFFSNEQPIKQRDKTMKTRLLDALVGLAISFALPTFAQQANTPDPQLREQLLALSKKFDDAYNKGDAAALAALYTEDAIEVTDQGPIYGRKALEKHFADLFQKVHFSNHLLTLDQDSPHIIGTTGNEAWETGAWSLTVQGENFGPIQQKGYHSSIAVREDGVWKKRLVTWNVTPAPAAKPSPTTSPSSQ